MNRQVSRTQAWLGSIVLILVCASTTLAQTQSPGEIIYNTNFTTGTVTGFNSERISANPVIPTFRVPETAVPSALYPPLSNPAMIAQSPFSERTLLATEETGGSIAAIDSRSNDSVGVDSSGNGAGVSHGGVIGGRIPLSIPIPWGISITPNGRLAFVGNRERFIGLNTPTSDLVSVVDVFRGIEIATINVSAQGTGPIDVACSPDGRLCYVACSASRNVVAIDVATLTLDTSAGFPVVLPGNDVPVDICVTNRTPGNPAGTFVYVACVNRVGDRDNTGTVAFFDVATKTPGVVTGLIAGTSEPSDVFTNYAANTLYIVDQGGNAVFVASIATQAIITNVLLLAALAQPSQVCLSRDDALGYVSDTGNNALRQFRTATNLETAITFSANPPDTGPLGVSIFQIMDLPLAAKEDQQNAVQGTDSHSNNKRGLCFIATASFGNSPEVAALRAFRDLYLMPTKFGRSFVDLYYESSPGVANLIADRESVAGTVRGGLAPVVLLARVVMSTGAALPVALGLLALGSFGLLAGRRVLRHRAKTA